MKTILGVLALSAAMTACSHAAAPSSVAVFHSLGARQCEQGGVTPDALADRLHSAGVKVSAISCGSDGRMRPAMCGAPDGRLAVFDIPAEQLQEALAQGFRAWKELPDGQRQPCGKT